jgi:hypothetical protein
MDQITARRNSAVNLGIPSFADSSGLTITTLLSHQHHR